MIYPKNTLVWRHPWSFIPERIDQKEHLCTFLDAPTHLCKRLCPLVGRSVGWSVHSTPLHSTPLRTTRSAPFRSASLRSTPLRSRRSAPLRAASRRSFASEKAAYHNMQMRSGRIVGLRWPCFTSVLLLVSLVGCDAVFCDEALDPALDPLLVPAAEAAPDARPASP